MAAVWISVAVTVAGFALSVGTSAFISGAWKGKVTTDIEYIKRDVAAIMSVFRLVPAEQQDKRGRH